MESGVDPKPAGRERPPEQAVVRAIIPVDVRLDPRIARIDDCQRGVSSKSTQGRELALTSGVARLEGERVDEEVEEHGVPAGGTGTTPRQHGSSE